MSDNAEKLTLDSEGYLIGEDGERVVDDDGEPILFKRQSEISELIVRYKSEAERWRKKAKAKGSEPDSASADKIASLEDRIEELLGTVNERESEIKRLTRQIEKTTGQLKEAEQRAEKAIAESDDEYITNQLLAAAAHFEDPRDAVLNLRSVARLERDESGKRRVVFPTKIKGEDDREIEKDLPPEDAVKLLGERCPRYVKGNPAGGPGGPTAKGGVAPPKPWAQMSDSEKLDYIEKNGPPPMEVIMSGVDATA